MIISPSFKVKPSATSAKPLGLRAALVWSARSLRPVYIGKKYNSNTQRDRAGIITF